VKAHTVIVKSALHVLASHQIAKQQEAHTIGGSLLLAVMKEVLKAMNGEKQSKQ